MTRLKAGAPTHKLVHALAAAGWGDLAGRDLHGVRATLRALSERIPDRSGQGLATAWQIATTSGYSERWTRVCLAYLEDLELIEWTRGTVVNGRPTPSWFRIRREALLALLVPARQLKDEALLALRRRTAARLRGLRVLTIRRRARLPRSNRAALAASLPPNGEDSGPSPLSVSTASTSSARPAWCDEHEMPNQPTAKGLPGCPTCRHAVTAQRATR